MRHLWIVGLLLVLLVPASVAAGDGDGAQVKALEALKVRLDAKMREAELLESTGRTDEALRAYREIGTIYETEVERIARLFGNRVVRVRRPVAVPVQPPTRPRLFPTPLLVKDPDAGEVDAALKRAVAWLVSHQSPNGGWEAANFGVWCDGKPRAGENASSRPDGAGKALYDVGVTGLALNALMAAGVKPGQPDAASQSLMRGLRYLTMVQDPEGCFGPRSTQQYSYNHASAALALINAYALVALTGDAAAATLDARWKAPVQRALDFTALSRNPYFAWRYGIKPGDNDTSVTTWMASAIKRAKDINEAAIERGRPAPFTVDESAFDGVRAWLQKVTDPDYGRVGYLQRGSGSARPQALIDRFPSEMTEAMTSAGVLMRHWMGESMKTHPVIKKSVALILKTVPVWNLNSGQIDMYAWLIGTQAMSQVGGASWVRWRNAACQALVPTQRRDTQTCDYLGSWDPVGPWGSDGGRVYSTALCALILATCRDGL